MRPHNLQRLCYNTSARFVVNPAGRRSGKTELAKRKVIVKALAGTRFQRPRFFCAAPTRDQAKRIYWDDLKAMVPRDFIKGRPSETELVIDLVNGASISVVGMDKPERIEGTPWDGGVLDEYANMKPNAWQAHVRPALSDRQGWCVMIGGPEGRNHYYDLWRNARASQGENGRDSEWAGFTWTSADILPKTEIENARRDLDPMVFRQEYEASFINFSGRAYYAFSEESHCAPLRDKYDMDHDLILCFDFNVSPQVVAVCQEMILPNGAEGTAVIDEIWIPDNSNTNIVVNKIIEDWSGHRGHVVCHGDASGGARGTSQTMGSDWDIIEQGLRGPFKGRLAMRYPKSNPTQRSRVNAMNTRMKAGDGAIRMMVDPSTAPHVVADLEGVRLIEGGAGELDKKNDPQLTHISDALGYYIAEQWPVTSGDRVTVGDMAWV